MNGTARQPGSAGGRELRALGPVIVTETELALLEDAHRRLLGDPAPPSAHEGSTEAHAGEREARRSLVVRGLLDEDGELPEDDDVALLVSTVLDVRLAADRVLVTERIVAGDGLGSGTARSDREDRPTDLDVSRGTRLVHLVDSGACVEDVLPEGAHHLYLVLDPEEVVPWVTGVTVPPDAVAATGPSLVVHPDHPEAIPRMLGRPTVLAELSVLPSSDEAFATVRDGEASPAHQLLALGPSGCWVAEVEPGRSLPEGVVFRPVSPGWVAHWVRSALDLRTAPGGPGTGGDQGTMSG